MPNFKLFSKDKVKDAEQHNHCDGDRHIEEGLTTSDTITSDTHDASKSHNVQAQRQDSSSSSPLQTFGVGEPLPPLHIPHGRRKRTLWFGVFLITLDLACLPITYYYSLNFGTDLSPQAIFAILTGVYGLISFTHYGMRSEKLFRAKLAPKWRPVGWTKCGLFEFLHINFAIAIIFVELELIIGSIPEHPWVRLCAMASPTICYWFGFVFTYSAIQTMRKVPLPFNMSSTEKGKLWRPAMLALVEDVGGLEAEGGVLYRSNVMRRYEVSPIFRRMMLVLSWVWGVGLLCVAIASTVIIMILPVNIGFGIGWGFPYLFGVVWVCCSIKYVNMQLLKEKRDWETKASGEGHAAGFEFV